METKTIPKVQNVDLTAKDVVKYYKGSEQLIIYLKSESGKAIVGESIYVKLNGKESEILTDSSGKAVLDLNLPSGNYVALIFFNETDRYRSASTNASINISKTVEGIDQPMHQSIFLKLLKELT